MMRSDTIIGRARRWLAIAGLIMGLSAVVPSGSITAASQHAAAATALRIWYGTDDPTERPWALELARRFSASHPSVHVVLTTYGLDDLNDKMQLAMGSGHPPDLVYTTPRGPGLPAYIRAGQLRDLTTAARQGGWASALRPGLLDSYNRLLASNSSHAAAGHIYAVPYDMAAVGVLYNKALFARLHLAVPHTLAAFSAALVRVKKAGLTPLGLGNADGWLGDDWYLTLVNALVDPVSLVPELQLSASFSFGKPAFRTAAAMLQDWAQRDYFTPDFGGLDAQDGMVTFFQGHTAMQLVSSTEDSPDSFAGASDRPGRGYLLFPQRHAWPSPRDAAERLRRMGSAPRLLQSIRCPRLYHLRGLCADRKSSPGPRNGARAPY